VKESPPTTRSAIHVVGAAILDGDRCLATQRSAAMSMPLLWEFPGGKVGAGEPPREALRRELEEELGIAIEVGDLLARGVGTLEQRTIHLDVYRARIVGSERPTLREHHTLGWFTADELERLEWPDADAPAVRQVCELLRGAR